MPAGLGGLDPPERTTNTYAFALAGAEPGLLAPRGDALLTDHKAISVFSANPLIISASLAVSELVYN